MKIAVRGTNWVGDAVMTVPALRELRRIFPGSHISLLQRRSAAGIFDGADFIDECIFLGKGRAAFLKDAAALRKMKFDLAILFTNSFESALLAKAAGISERIGYATEKRSFLLSSAFAPPEWKDERHEVFYYLDLVDKIENRFFGKSSVPDEVNSIWLDVSEERKEAALDLLFSHGAAEGKKIVALGVGSANSRAKRWPPANYAALSGLLEEGLDCSVVLVGSPEDLTVAEEVAALAPGKPIVLAGKTSLSEAVAVLSVCSLLVANDMGPAHIAPAVGAKALVIFGPTNWKTTLPIGAGMIRKEVDCSPCMLRDCPIDHRCMVGIRPEEVFERAKALLK